jgi:hypothetical protein
MCFGCFWLFCGALCTRLFICMYTCMCIQCMCTCIIIIFAVFKWLCKWKGHEVWYVDAQATQATIAQDPHHAPIVNTEYKRSVIITFVRTHVHVSLRTMGYSNNIPIVTRYMYKLIWNYSSHRCIPASLWKPGYITPGHHLPHPMRQLLFFFPER